MNANKNYKDSVFSRLFSDPDTLRELYGAIEGLDLPPDIPVTINTLENILYRDRINDISFEIAGKLVVLIEHQSSINPNMPLRLLLYIGRIYEKIIGGKNVYSGKKAPIPAPRFIVLYNGTSEYPDESILKLSDSFTDAVLPGLVPKLPELELYVKVYNINKGHNEAILQKSKKLNGYSTFVAKIREYGAQGQPLKDALKLAVNWCITHNILEEFLEPHGSEVVNMLTTEWDWDTAFAVCREEGIEEGRELGRQEAAVRFAEMGLSVETIAAGLGITVEEAERALNRG
jgi:hypothetical protein